MPESMFGRPLQHLLPSQPSASTGGSPGTSESHTAPVQLAAPQFKDFRFNSIGKQPELLSRISLPHPDSTDCHSSTPSPTSTPPLNLINDPQSKPSSRPTLLQQLAPSNLHSLGRGSRWNASTSQPNVSLASRIQMNGSPPHDVVAARGAASRHSSPPSRTSPTNRVPEDASLIPPVEVLIQPPDSLPPTPTSWAPVLESVDIHSPAYSAPLMDTTPIATSRVPTPPTNAASQSLTETVLSLAVVDTVTQEPSTPTTVADSLVTRQERLQSISARLANLASPLPPSSRSPPLDPPPVTRGSTLVPSNQRSQSQHSSTPIFLHPPYSTEQSPASVGLSVRDSQIQTSDSSLAPLSPPSLAQEFQTQGRAIATAVQNLNSALNAAHRAQIDSGSALTLRIRTFEERCAAFEQTRRTQEDALQKERQELQQKCEELNAKEAMMVSLEKENKVREETRRTMLAERQIQEEEKRVFEAKRVQEVQEQITIAVNELKEIETLKAKYRVEQLTNETVQNDLPTEPREGMGDEESAAIQLRNKLLRAVEHLRWEHTVKVQRLEETNRTLRRLGAERKSREADEEEHHRVKEQRLRAHEVHQTHQLLDEGPRRFEAERKPQDVENDREQARILVEQQAHAEAQAQGMGQTEETNIQMLEHPSQVSVPQQKAVTDKAGDKVRIRAARGENIQGNTNVMIPDGDGGNPIFHRTALSSDARTNPGTSPSKKKKNKPVSGGVMLATTSPKADNTLPPKPLVTPPSLPSDHAAVNITNAATLVSAEGVHKTSSPSQIPSGFSRGTSIDTRLTPDYKSPFSRTPKSQTILDAASGGSQELSIGPVAGVSPTQQNVNLRHLKRFRVRGEGNDSGDRSVRTVEVKVGDLPLKREEGDDQSRELVQASFVNDLPASLPPRPSVIPPPRPRISKRPPASQPNPSSSYLTENEQPSRSDEQHREASPREAIPRVTPTFQTTTGHVQLPAPPEATASLLLGPMDSKPQASESRIDMGERPIQDRDENNGSVPSESGGDPSKSNRRFTDEHHGALHANGSRRVSDHYSPPSRSAVTSPTEVHRPSDFWRPQNSNSSHGPRAEPMRATSPIAGRKRPSEYSDNDFGRRARRRNDVWIAEHEHDRDTYRSHWDRRPDPESDERHAAHRSLTSPVERTRPHVLRTSYDNRPYSPEESAVPRREQPHRRTENDDTYHQSQSSMLAYDAGEHHTDTVGAGQIHEPMAEERMDTQPDPTLLARMGDTQYFPPRGRGRGEPSRGRGDFGRGRGRGATRGGPPLIERLKEAPSSLGDRLT